MGRARNRQQKRMLANPTGQPLPIHVYGQVAWHDEAAIIGTREALEALRKAVDHALSSSLGVGVVAAEIPSDGEGYELWVAVASTEEMRHTLAVPYTKDYAEEQREGALWPMAFLAQKGAGTVNVWDWREKARAQEGDS